jgi:hypothetical protein
MNEIEQFKKFHGNGCGTKVTTKKAPAKAVAKSKKNKK